MLSFIAIGALLFGSSPSFHLFFIASPWVLLHSFFIFLLLLTWIRCLSHFQEQRIGVRRKKECREEAT